MSTELRPRPASDDNDGPSFAETALKLGGNESYPGEFQPTGGFADDAVVRDGRVGLTDIPGIGFEGKAAFYAELRKLHA